MTLFHDAGLCFSKPSHNRSILHGLVSVTNNERLRNGTQPTLNAEHYSWSKNVVSKVGQPKNNPKLENLAKLKFSQYIFLITVTVLVYNAIIFMIAGPDDTFLQLTNLI